MAQTNDTMPSWLDPKDISDSNKVRSNWIKWGKPGDGFKGVLLEKRKMEVTYQGVKKDVEVFEFSMQAGEFHNSDEMTKQPIEPGVKIKAGDVYSVGDNCRLGIMMRNVRPGDVVVVRYKEQLPPKVKGNAPAKILETYVVGHQDDYYTLTGSAKAESSELEPMPF